MDRAGWERIRRGVIARQRGKCHRCPARPKLLDVIPTKTGRRAFCRSCRLKHDAPERVAKARRTRALRRAQLRLPFGLQPR